MGGTVPTTAFDASHPMVEYLNSLRTQEQGGNASYIHEQRSVFLKGLRDQYPWFPTDAELHVSTRLDALGAAMLDRNTFGADLVFLTGDAGDGKTALCDVLAPVLAGSQVELGIETVAGDWLIVKDASEIAEPRLRELIGERLKGNTPRGLLVAINEGRLRRVMREHTAVWPEVVEPSLRTLFSADDARILDDSMGRHRILVLNFRQRFHVRSVLPALIERWTRSALWDESPVCGGCAQRAQCPILANVTALREPAPRAWLADLLANAHFSGQRLPFRRLQALLALSCTGGLHCGEVRSGAFADLGALRALRHRYYEVLFPPQLSEAGEVRRELLCAALAPMDPGHRVDRAIDSDVLELVAPAQDKGTLPALEGHQLPSLEAQAIAAARKRYASDEPQEDFVRSLTSLTRSLRRWFDVVRPNRASPPRWLEAQRLLEQWAGSGDSAPLLAAVINALNILHGPAWKPNSLLRNQADPAGFRDPGRLALELDLKTEFETRVVCGPLLPSRVDQWLESLPSDIELQVWPAKHPETRASLQLDARLVDALLAVRSGYTALGGLGPFRRDLSRFFGKLGQLAHAAVGPPLVSILVHGRRTRVTTSGDAGKARLSFEADA